MKEGKTMITVKDMRLAMDYTGLNKGSMQPGHTIPSSSYIMDRIPAGSDFF